METYLCTSLCCWYIEKRVAFSLHTMYVYHTLRCLATLHLPALPLAPANAHKFLYLCIEACKGTQCCAKYRAVQTNNRHYVAGNLNMKQILHSYWRAWYFKQCLPARRKDFIIFYELYMQQFFNFVKFNGLRTSHGSHLTIYHSRLPPQVVEKNFYLSLSHNC